MSKSQIKASYPYSRDKTSLLYFRKNRVRKSPLIKFRTNSPSLAFGMASLIGRATRSKIVNLSETQRNASKTLSSSRYKQSAWSLAKRAKILKLSVSLLEAQFWDIFCITVCKIVQYIKYFISSDAFWWRCLVYAGTFSLC